MGWKNIATKSMNESQLKQLENQIEVHLKDFGKSVTPTIGQINKLLDREYEKEIDDQINFLRNIAVMAGVVAPLSLTLLTNQSLNIEKPFLLAGFVLLLVTVLISLFFSKKLTIDTRYKDTPSLALNHIIARCSVDDLLDTKKSLSDRTNTSAEILKCIDEINSKFSNLGYTNKLVNLRNKLAESNRWSTFLFSFGLIFIITSVIYPHIFNFLTFLLITLIVT